MQDYWNDPPEHPEPPECCGEIMDVLDDGSLACPHCGIAIPPPDDIDAPDFGQVDPEEFEPPTECPHGRPFGSCCWCEKAADLAFNSKRERMGKR